MLVKIQKQCLNIQNKQIYLEQVMLKDILIVLIAVGWIGLGWWASSLARKTFKKYQNYTEIPSLDPKFLGLVRTDYSKWDKQRIIVGCFALFPIRLFFFATMIIGCLVFATLLKISGNSTVINNLFTLYFNTYCKLVTRIMCNVQEQFKDRKITTPIAISNHTNWYDIFYIAMGNAPLSYVAKAEVKNWPFIGTIATSRKCVYVDRDSEQGRNGTREQIKQRIQDIKNKKDNLFPLVIFPEGTTSNGNGLLRFKSGAFENLSPVTAFCLKYECENFTLGMDEITQPEHVILMMSQLPKLIVKKIIFEPNTGETAEQYQNRIRDKMAEVLGIPCTESGYRDRVQLQKLRQKKQN